MGVKSNCKIWGEIEINDNKSFNQYSAIWGLFSSSNNGPGQFTFIQ